MAPCDTEPPAPSVSSTSTTLLCYASASRLAIRGGNNTDAMLVSGFVVWVSDEHGQVV